MANLLNFYGLEGTSSDFPGHFSLVLYVKKCMLACYGCHNRKTLCGWDYKDKNYKRNNIISIDNNLVEQVSYENIRIEIESGLYDSVILCGGEITIHPLQQIIDTIQYIKSINPKILIRLDTNSIFPEKMKELNKYIDGYGCDIKFPYHLWDCGNGKYDTILSDVVGLPFDTIKRMELPIKMLKGLHIANEKEHTIYRTVKYPFINDNYFTDIEKYVKTNFKGKDYYQNNFIYV